MEWGKYTWFLFHTLAEKIKSDEFVKYKSLIIKIIVGICSCLPCPVCTKHASEYLKMYPIYSVKNKEDLKRYIFIFHNTVNKKKNKEIQNPKILEMYKKANLPAIITIFNQKFKTSAPNLMAEQMFRKNKLNEINLLLRNNFHIFEK
jgi:hypothetical protein